MITSWSWRLQFQPLGLPGTLPREQVGLVPAAEDGSSVRQRDAGVGGDPHVYLVHPDAVHELADAAGRG